MTTTTALPTVGAKGTNPLRELLEYGQSPWMDYIRRDLLTSGGLKKMIHEDGLRGMTSNPTIFEKAITGSKDYADILESPEAKKLDAKGVYEKIAIRDVQDATRHFQARLSANQAARRLRQPGSFSAARQRHAGHHRGSAAPVEERGARKRDDQGSRHPEGIPAIRALLEEGININITLLFAQSAYEQVAEAFLAALEARAKKGQDISHIASVASFFVSRIDTLIDSQDRREAEDGNRCRSRQRC